MFVLYYIISTHTTIVCVPLLHRYFSHNVLKSYINQYWNFKHISFRHTPIYNEVYRKVYAV